MPEMNIAAIVETFVGQITAAVEASAAQRIQDALAGTFREPQKRKPGRPPKQVAAPVPTTKAAAKRKAVRVTPKVAQARKLQGQYLGALRALSALDKAKVKAVAKEKGVAEAVKLALSLKKS
jgi:hypothetical protein